jgi:hypothetical protein
MLRDILIIRRNWSNGLYGSVERRA